MIDLRATVLDGLDLYGKDVLEIGPLDRPIVRRSKEVSAFYLDHCSSDELRKKYKDNPVIKPGEIVDIDFVARDGRVSPQALGSNSFDVIVASHVIEHVPNLAKWIWDSCNALNPGGVLALVIPDRRYTFDYFRRVTPKAWIEAAHAFDYLRPGLENVCDHFCNVAHVSALDVWSGKDVSQAPRVHDGDIVSRAISDWIRGQYIDCHSWVFECDGFAELIEWMCRRFGIAMRVERLIPPIEGQLEFYAQIRRE